MPTHAPTLSLYALRSLARALVRWPAIRAIDPQLRERVILHVSSVNVCAVCSAFHTRAGHRVGLTDEDIRTAQSLHPGGLDARTDAALRYAELRTLDRERDHPEDVAHFERLFTPAEQRALRATIDLFTFNNRFNNTWERLVPGAAKRRRELGK